MSQPVWKFVANLGDKTPLDYGGYFVYIDTTGVYDPEAVLLEVPDKEPEPDKKAYRIYRFCLEPCTFINGILSDNQFHPDKPAWFAKPESERAERPQDTTYLENISCCYGMKQEELVKLFCSEDPCERAEAWRMVGEYHGWTNLDSYPLDFTRAEVEERYGEECK